MENFGEKIRIGRVKKHLSQKQLAQQIGVSRTIVVAWENETRKPKFEHLIKLVHLLEINL